ncbi:MAG: cytochrome c nitrite reductase small subunit [Planctomycetes bacterium]|nr:cytochrome c nitrite reductase small subunit [Planctomycetota bacterium]
MALETATILRLGAAAALGVAVGLGGYTFVYAKGGSYMTNDPAACANCHVMQEQFDGWQKSSHHKVAVCNDCHVPMDSFFAKWWVKSTNGWHHSSAFTTGDYPEHIRAKERSREVLETQCRRCHEDIAETVDGHGDATRSCVTCHDSVGHLR